MIALWYSILGLMFTMFMVRDGWDFGAGAIHLLVARNDAERRQVFAAIGPLWSWNEVWVVGAGGVLALAFPRLMGLTLSGFYLALFLVLWALLLRGIAIEVRGHIDEPLWQAFWDLVFAVSNTLMAVLPGVAIGNLLRGVPLDGSGEFSLPLFTNFNVNGRTGLLDWYTILVGLFSGIVLCAHGATYLALKTEGGVHNRSVGTSRRLWTAALLSFPAIAWMTWYVRRDFYTSLMARPAGWFAIAAVLAGGALLATGGSREGRGFAGSCCAVTGLTAGAVTGLFPMILRSTVSDVYSVSINQGGGDGAGLFIGVLWWPVAFGLALFYMYFIGKNYRGKVKPSQDTQGFY